MLNPYSRYISEEKGIVGSAPPGVQACELAESDQSFRVQCESNVRRRASLFHIALSVKRPLLPQLPHSDSCMVYACVHMGHSIIYATIICPLTLIIMLYASI